MPMPPDPFVAQALAARAKIVSALDEIHALLAECDDEEVPTWTAQVTELGRALAMIDEQLALHRQDDLSDDPAR